MKTRAEKIALLKAYRAGKISPHELRPAMGAAIIYTEYDKNAKPVTPAGGIHIAEIFSGIDKNL